MRLINADALVAKMEADAEHIDNAIIKMLSYSAVDDVKNAPTVEERELAPKWHSIYSDPPDEPGEYLLTVEGRQSGRRWVDKVYFNGTSFDHYYLAKPVAWAEMPEPYSM